MTTETETSNDIEDDSPHWLNLFAKLSLSIDKMTSVMQRQQLDAQRRLAILPRSFIIPAGVNLDGAGQAVYSFGGPQPGREWIVRELMAVHAGYTFLNPTGTSTTTAAGAAGSVSLPGGGCVVTGFDVSIGPAVAAGLATVTLSNVPGGPYTYFIDEVTGASEQFSKTLNLPTNSSPTLSVNAVASGGVVALNLYGTLNQGTAEVTWYQGQNPNYANTGVLPQTMARARMHGTPSELTYTSDVIRIIQNEQLYAGIVNGAANGQIILAAKILDQPAFAERFRVATE